ncbi:Ankyrin repeat-containing protein [Hirschfeldia incana]|nr:Ankyrin repeat-containing protein [Hirschfeldia incana]
MGQMQSKKKLMFNHVRSGNVEGIRALCLEGADLEWMDKEGNTPLILACKKSELYDVAQTLIQLGANVNAHPPAPRDATPLYHAARRGLEKTVKLLLSNGANYDCQTALQQARYYKFTNVVRVIESHICVFSGWMREFYGPSLLGVLAPQLLSKRVWVVIIPTSSIYPKPYKFELVVYASLKDAQPRVVMALRNQNLEEPQEMHPNTSVTIVDNDNTKKKSLKLAPSIEEGRQQLKWFCDACKGIPQPVRPPVVVQTVLPSAPPLADDYREAVEEEIQMHYPLSGSTTPSSASVGGENTEDRGSSAGQCLICMDAPSDGICVPCGHVAGCMSCLTQIKSHASECPICRANIHQVIKVYRV